MVHHTVEPSDDNPTPDPIVKSRRIDGIPSAALKLLPLLVAFVLGGATGTITMLVEGDKRYPTRTEFKTHTDQNEDLKLHATADKKDFATKEELNASMAALRTELKAHNDLPSHPGVKEELTAIRVTLASVQADLAWLKVRELKRGP